MRQLLFAVFADRNRACRAQTALRDDCNEREAARVRLHEGEVDLHLGIDLSGTRTQGAREGDIVWRFGVVFFLCALAGVAIDTGKMFGDAAWSATMALGCIGVVLGTFAVLRATSRPIDAALIKATDALEQGHVLLTVPTTDILGRESVVATVSAHGGRLLFEA